MVERRRKGGGEREREDEYFDSPALVFLFLRAAPLFPFLSLCEIILYPANNHCFLYYLKWSSYFLEPK